MFRGRDPDLCGPRGSITTRNAKSQEKSPHLHPPSATSTQQQNLSLPPPAARVPSSHATGRPKTPEPLPRPPHNPPGHLRPPRNHLLRARPPPEQPAHQASHRPRKTPPHRPRPHPRRPPSRRCHRHTPPAHPKRTSQPRNQTQSSYPTPPQRQPRPEERGPLQAHPVPRQPRPSGRGSPAPPTHNTALRAQKNPAPSTGFKRVNSHQPITTRGCPRRRTRQSGGSGGCSPAAP